MRYEFTAIADAEFPGRPEPVVRHVVTTDAPPGRRRCHPLLGRSGARGPVASNPGAIAELGFSSDRPEIWSASSVFLINSAAPD